jgi:hypothetical protein
VIPRYQTILFSLLVLASIVMGVFLWQMRDRAHKRMLEGEDSAPTAAPEVAAAQQATLYVASDADNALTAQQLTLPLPTSPGPRARAILGKLLDLYAAPNAPHPVPGGSAAVAEVFLLSLPGGSSASAATSSVSSQAVPSPASTLALIRGSAAAPAAQTASQTASSQPAAQDQAAGPQLALVNLTGAFANAHPSGLETESLTVLSICATLHANLPNVMEVRFLVDGAPRTTLAGHADLTRTYLADQAAPATGIHP